MALNCPSSMFKQRFAELCMCVCIRVCLFQVRPGAEPGSGRGTKRKEPEGEAGSRQRLNDRRDFQPSPADSGKLL